MARALGHRWVRWLTAGSFILIGCGEELPRSEAVLPLAPADFVVAGLGEDVDSLDVADQLGLPDSVIRGQLPDDPDVELLAWSYPGLAVAFGDGGMRYGVTLTGPALATHRGLRVGDSVPRVLALYGRPASRAPDAWDYLMADDPGGFHAIRIGLADDRVRWIYLGWLME